MTIALAGVLAQTQGADLHLPLCDGDVCPRLDSDAVYKDQEVTGELEGRCPPSCTVQESIRAAAALYGIPYTRLSCLVRRESTYNPNATNGPYAGLAQFDAQTWTLTPYREYSRFNGWANIHAAAYLLSLGQGSRWPVWARGEC